MTVQEPPEVQGQQSPTQDSKKNDALLLNYGLIGNGQISALVSSSGSIDFLCMPKFDSPFVFNHILDQTIGGFFSIQPANVDNYTVTQTYARNSNVLITHYTSNDIEHVFAITDFMPRWHVSDYNISYTPLELCRIIEIKKGNPSIVVAFNPVYGYTPNETHPMAVDAHTVQASHQTGKLFLVSNLSAQAVIDQTPITLTEDSFFILSHQEPVKHAVLSTVKERLLLTNQYWHRWVKTCYLPKEYQVQIIRSALILKLMIYESTGAIVAATTTSLPEIVGGIRNWDYRFCWIRDSYFTTDALLKLSKFKEAEHYVDYLSKIILQHPDYLKPLYTIEGDTVPPVSHLDHLTGFGHSRPVRIGNDATLHHQTDAYGEVVLSISPLLMDERSIRKDCDELWDCVVYAVEKAIEKFPEKDNGIWEFGDRCEHFTFSKLLCWVAVDRGCKIAGKLKKDAYFKQWNRQRKVMREEILKHAWNESVQAFTQSYGRTDLDASTLLMPSLGIIDPKDPRMVSTIQRSEEQLLFNGLMFRYTNVDELGKPENAFTICTFWFIDALALSGQKRKARKYFDQVLSYGNHLGLFSEDINQKSGDLTGNFPQAYTHVAIINSAMLLANH
ncbi:MAG: glycoside hydrolase family 15 protein [Cyanobacteria bacterium P01_H01_bin.74]